MNGTIWISYARPRPHWYGLDEAVKAEHLAKWASVAAASLAKGAESLGRYHIRGQQDFETTEIWRFASPEQAFDHWSRLTAAGYNQWFAFMNNVGEAVDAG
ncbi:hypothetical protein ACELLULO517_24975 [Acidisoma cellulosilytica]|uniref:Uncharacterized protein n=1 Tax=Acidisoma cellulosilyticum TaxID=2802395 RepID=A0A963Z5Z7_9PROT|nr:hypothetical protein [Acidisoma cellulosilyticum]MCB8883525.1 hypothetical protein [Acidisoma cellulosilyticum]